MECEPVVSDDVVNVATPDELRMPVPIAAEPSMNVTFPLVGPSTDAVRVTAWPKLDGFKLELNVVDVCVCPAVLSGLSWPRLFVLNGAAVALLPSSGRL